MNNFRRNDRSGGRRHDTADFRRRDSGPREMFDAVCSECGKNCKIPFQPKTDKPIFCDDCFKNKGGSSRTRGNFRRSGDDTNKKLLQKVNELNDKVDKILKALNIKNENKTNVIIKKETKAKEEKKENTMEKSKETSPQKVKEADEVKTEKPLTDTTEVPKPETIFPD